MWIKSLLFSGVGAILVLQSLGRAGSETLPDRHEEIAPTIVLFFSDLQVNDKGLPVVVEIGNPGTQPIRVLSTIDLRMLWVAAPGHQVVRSVEERGLDDSDKFTPTMYVGVPIVVGQEIPGGVNASIRLTKDKDNISIAAGQSILVRVDMPSHIFPTGTATLRLALVRHGTEVATSKQSRISKGEEKGP